jgi:hypothetical protein
MEVFTDIECNIELWRFWSEKQGARVKTLEGGRFYVQLIHCTLLVAREHFWNRSTYYEVHNQQNVGLVELNVSLLPGSPILESKSKRGPRDLMLLT